MLHDTQHTPAPVLFWAAMPIYLVRHGETVWNVERRLQGRLDSALTPRGHAQAAAFAELLHAELSARARAGRDDIELCASPLGRARATAARLRERLCIAPERCSESELLAERSCGAWEGLLWSEVEQRHGPDSHELMHRWDLAAGGHGETLEQVYARAAAWLAQPRRARHVVVVTHGILSRQFRGAYLGLSPERTRALPRHTQDRLFVLENGVIRERVVAPA